MDAITLLKDDHQNVEKLFKRFEAAGDRAYVEKRDVVDRIIEELSRHAAVEEQLFYPVTRATVPETDRVVLESVEEHRVAKWLLDELQDLDVRDERFDAKVTVLIENVRHHVEEEETEYFPKVRDELGRKALGELGDAMADAKITAPTHPHPRSPSMPPGNVVAGNVAGVIDRIRDTAVGLVRGAFSVPSIVLDRVRGTTTPQPSPSGPSATRRATTAVRSGTEDALDRTVEAVRAAKQTGEATAEAARTGAKRTAGAARTGAKRTAAEAKGARTRTTNAARRSAAAAR